MGTLGRYEQSDWTGEKKPGRLTPPRLPAAFPSLFAPAQTRTHGRFAQQQGPGRPHTRSGGGKTLTPQPICRVGDDLRLRQQLVLVLLLVLCPQPDLVWLRLHQNRHQLLWICVCDRCDRLEPVVPEDTPAETLAGMLCSCVVNPPSHGGMTPLRGPAFHKRDLGQGQEVCSGSGLQPVREVIECRSHGAAAGQQCVKARQRRLFREHSPPAHHLAEFDHSGSKSLTRLCETLDGPSWHVVLQRDSVNRHLVTEIPQLQSEIEPVVSPGDLLLFGGRLGQSAPLEPGLR